VAGAGDNGLSNPRPALSPTRLAVILTLAAAKMLTSEWVHVPAAAWILVIVVVLVVTVIASKWRQT
jgi:hypothetical protein